MILSFSEAGKSWDRTDLFRLIVLNFGSIKNKAVAKVFFDLCTDTDTDRIEEPPRTFYLDSCILYYIFHNE